MMSRLKIAGVAVMAASLLISCKGQEAEEAPLQRKAIPKPAVAKPAEGPEAKPAVEARPEEIKRRNPFNNYALTAKGALKEKAVRVKGPLECCELNLFKLVAVVTSTGNSYALIQAPDNKRYLIRSGDIIGPREGKIIRIDMRSVTVRENTVDESGKVIMSNDVEIRLPEEKR